MLVTSKPSCAVLVKLLEIGHAHIHIHVERRNISKSREAAKTHHFRHHLLLLPSFHLDVRVWVQHVHRLQADAAVGDTFSATLVRTPVDERVVDHTDSALRATSLARGDFIQLFFQAERVSTKVALGLVGIRPFFVNLVTKDVTVLLLAL